MGNIFYRGHKIIKDLIKGDFDRKAAEDLLIREGLFKKTGIPRKNDILGETAEPSVQYIDFVAECFIHLA